jgi:hypothetical protein
MHQDVDNDEVLDAVVVWVAVMHTSVGDRATGHVNAESTN